MTDQPARNLMGIAEATEQMWYVTTDDITCDGAAIVTVVDVPASQVEAAGHRVIALRMSLFAASHVCKLHNLWLGHKGPDIDMAQAMEVIARGLRRAYQANAGTTARAFIIREQVDLWQELHDTLQQGHATATWLSIKAAEIARRIIGAARLTCPTHFSDVPWPLLAGGVYRAVLDAGGVRVTMPTDEQWQALDDVMRAQGQTRATMTSAYAGTVKALDGEQERRFLAGQQDATEPD